MSATVKRHPVKGFFGGLFLGLGLSILAMVYGGVVVGSPLALVIVVAGVVLGVASSFALPAKQPKS
jgi:uncharacterized membrane protein SpoIIM required for sporulation